MQEDLVKAMSEPYYTKEEVGWIKNTFKGNVFALKTLRKFFIPTLNNSAPIGELHEFWTEDLELLSRMSPQDRDVFILARIKTIKHIEKVLSTLRVLAEVEDESEEQKSERKRKDSVR